MIPLIITAHAVTRYVERIGGTEDQAVAALSAPAIHLAANFGARVVRLTRGRVLLKFCARGDELIAVVITVVPIDATRLPFQLLPLSCGGPPWFADAPLLPEQENDLG